MAPQSPPEVISDPLGTIVGLVITLDPALAANVVQEAVAAAAGRKFSQRRLAQALVERPEVLVDGRSPAPRAVGDLLVGLRKLGTTSISAPRCANCDKEMRSFHCRDGHWYCAVCGPRWVPCAGCGERRRVAAIDRAGRPRCGSCLPDDGPEPIDILLAVIGMVAPTICAETVIDAVGRVTSQAGQRRQLAWAIQDRPDLLTGAGAQAPVPSVLRLIDALCESGATGIVRPACPHCRRTVTLSKARGGLRICRSCEARLRAVPCAGCGAVRDPATRDDQGRPLCSNCLVSDPANQEICVGCGRRRRVSVRSDEGPRCGSCRPVTEMTCSICGRFAPAEISKATGEPWCKACQKRWARCAGCGQFRPVRGGSTDRPLCAVCTRPDQSFWKRCPSCAEMTKLADGPCVRCALRQRLTNLLGGADGTVDPQLHALYDNLAAAQRPATALNWLKHEHTTAILGDIASGTLRLSHDTLDLLPAAKTVEHLRSVLVATAALPARDEHMVRIERWVTATIAARTDPDERYLLQRYAVWHLLRRLRRRRKGDQTTHNQTTLVKAQLRTAIELLDWLAHRHLTLRSANQGHLDTWITSEGAGRRGNAGHFVRWAASQKLTDLELPAVRWNGPSGTIDHDKRWEQARWLLRDDTLETTDRVAGLLVILYAQKLEAISKLTLDHIDHNDNGVGLRLGSRPVLLPEPLAALILDLAASRRGHAVLGDQGTSPWLFPGGQPGRPLSASRLAERLRALGVHAGTARSAALLQLATELPAAVMARMLGVHIKVAAEWQRAASGDWAGYAADYSRRETSNERPSQKRRQ
jgi:hypothetical protein